MAEHTKLPWRAETECWTPWDGAIGILPADGNEENAIAWTTSGSNEAVNAALIVKACSSHYALTSEVEGLRRWQQARLESDDLALKEHDALVKALRDVMDAANDSYEIARTALSLLRDPVGNAGSSGK